MLETAKLLRPTLGEQIEIEPQLAQDAWPALVDPDQLTTALLNLALNARDAMPDGGKLALETAQRPSRRRLCQHATPRSTPATT